MLHWDLVDAPNLGPAYDAALKSAGGLYDPSTGTLNADKQRAVFTDTIRALSLTPSPDAILIVSLVKTQAEQRSAVATWDGTSQQAMTLGAMTDASGRTVGKTDRFAGEGFIDASSLQVTLYDSQGTRVFQARGGIELLQQLSIKTEMHYPRMDYVQHLASRAPQELFNDGERIAAAVRASLRDLTASAP